MASSRLEPQVPVAELSPNFLIKQHPLGLNLAPLSMTYFQHHCILFP